MPHAPKVPGVPEEFWTRLRTTIREGIESVNALKILEETFKQGGLVTFGANLTAVGNTAGGVNEDTELLEIPATEPLLLVSYQGTLRARSEILDDLFYPDLITDLQNIEPLVKFGETYLHPKVGVTISGILRRPTMLGLPGTQVLFQSGELGDVLPLIGFHVPLFEKVRGGPLRFGFRMAIAITFIWAASVSITALRLPGSPRGR